MTLLVYFGLSLLDLSKTEYWKIINFGMIM